MINICRVAVFLLVYIVNDVIMSYHSYSMKRSLLKCNIQKWTKK